MEGVLALQIKEGKSIHFGATPDSKGVNFAVCVLGTTPVELILMNPETLDIFETIEIPYRTGYVRHLYVEGLQPPFAYAYRIKGHTGETLLLDPYAKAVKTPMEWNNPNPYRPIGLVVHSNFSWEDDKRPNIPIEDLVIYEMHVRGFTKDSSSAVKFPGTFLGIIEKIPYLKSLGINAVELMPLQEFNEKEYNPINPLYKGKLFQYWGYSSVNFFSPMNRYTSTRGPSGSIDDFKNMVKSLHQAGIEVIVDMVFNHTSEGNEQGPIHSYRGLAPGAYYMHTETGEYANYTGCGNTMNCNHFLVIELILDAMRYWVSEMHVDGFRFDLASIFYRDEDGSVLSSPPVVHAITKDPILASVKLISEPWDAAGLYQVGNFFPESLRWSEWNGRYRDCIRRFIKGDKGLKGEFASRVCGSEDLYGHNNRLPKNSINFITSHDGFSLRDLVSYNHKHNMNNGENNRDGLNENYSWNCGVEGHTNDKSILELRERQMRNLHLALMVSQGIPMIFMGDETGHTKNGNNNTWCQDNPLSWFLWNLIKTNEHFYRFYSGLIHFRLNHPQLRHREFLNEWDIQWHGKKPFDPEWEHQDNFVAYTLVDHEKGSDLYIAFNACDTEAEVNLPKRDDEKKWFYVVNTSNEPPQDFFDENQKVPAPDLIKMKGYSSLLLEAR